MKSQVKRQLWMAVVALALTTQVWAQGLDGSKALPKGYKILKSGPFEYAKDFSEGLAAVKVGHKWGFIDTNGTMVIEPQFNPKQSQFNSYFSDGLVAINFNDGTSQGMDGNSPPNTKWGFSDKRGRIVINPIFDGDYYNPPRFSEGLASIAADSPGGSEAITLDFPGIKFGYIDKAGKFAIEAKFEKAYDFKDGLAPVRSDGKWGFINKFGKFVIAPVYESVYQFSEGLAAVTFDGKSYFYIDKFGNRVNDKDFAVLSSLSEGLASFVLDGKTGFVNSAGKVVIEPQFTGSILFAVGNFSEGLCLVEFGNNGGSKSDDWFFGKFGYINKKGAIVINPKFGFSSNFKNGIAQVQFDGKAGYINKLGEFVIPYIFSEAGDFNDGVARVQFKNYGNYFFIKKLQPNAL